MLDFGYVYFIQVFEKGPIKIGWTLDEPNDRFSCIQSGNHCLLARRGVLVGAPSLEDEIHARFGQYRYRAGGEWFTATRSLANFINENCAPWPTRDGKSWCVLPPGEMWPVSTRPGREVAECRLCEATFAPNGLATLLADRECCRFAYACEECAALAGPRPRLTSPAYPYHRPGMKITA